MTIPPESIAVGKCYLADRREAPQVWRVIAIFPDGQLEYQHRSADPAKKQVWRTAMTTVRLFVGAVTREVPCDWTPGGEERP